MKEYSGKSACGGIAIGRIHLMDKKRAAVARYKVEDIRREIRRFDEARRKAESQLAGLYEKAVQEVGEAYAAIFETHRMMLEDDDYLVSVKDVISGQKVNAEYAVASVSERFAELFASMDNTYMKERAADVRDISDRVVRILKGLDIESEGPEEAGLPEGTVCVREAGWPEETVCAREAGQPEEMVCARAAEASEQAAQSKGTAWTGEDVWSGEAGWPGEPVIVLADDLVPSETVQIDKELVLSFVTVHGSVDSHTAILARTMNIPSLVGVNIEISEELEGKMAVVDGSGGMLYIEPDRRTIARMEERNQEEAEKRRLLQGLRGKENVTKSGRQVLVHANIGNVRDLDAVLQNDAGGIGLFRSEFIYLESNTYPTEEEQFRIYKKTAQAMAGKRVIIRTLDIGADKQADYFRLDKEENPAMGLRAIRLCLTRPEIFKTQLRAVYRASEYGRLGIMYPMITSLEEIRKIKQISAEVRAELDRERIPYQDVEEGIMIETPAAAIISDLLAKEVDFFSIGTNDLSQYTMAVDRQNPKLDAFFDPHHEAVLRMAELVCRNAHAENIWVGICGELGADLELTERFLRMGVDEFSVSPARILPLRDRIRSLE